MKEKDLISEQVEYYRARAPEYDEWFLRQGRYDRGEEHRARWDRELDQVRDELVKHRPFGSVLELACGTGLWTPQLVSGASSVTAVDAVVETIEENRRKTNDPKIEYRVEDIFQWEPDRRYDFIFFGFWLSHVPQTLFRDFWDRLRRGLGASGRVFFVDSLQTQSSTATDHAAIDDSGVVQRKLNDGRTFHVVKRFYTVETLKELLDEAGWESELATTGEFFLYGTAKIQEGGEEG